MTGRTGHRLPAKTLSADLQVQQEPHWPCHDERLEAGLQGFHDPHCAPYVLYHISVSLEMIEVNSTDHSLRVGCTRVKVGGRLGPVPSENGSHILK